MLFRLLCIEWSFKIFCLFERQIWHRGEMEKVFICWFTPKWSQWSQLCWPKAGSQEFPPGVPSGRRFPRAWTILLCFPGCKQKAGSEAEQLYMNWYLYGMPVLQGEDFTIESSRWTPKRFLFSTYSEIILAQTLLFYRGRNQDCVLSSSVQEVAECSWLLNLVGNPVVHPIFAAAAVAEKGRICLWLLHMQPLVVWLVEIVSP